MKGCNPCTMSITSRNLFTGPNSQFNSGCCTSRKTHLRNPKIPVLFAQKPLVNPGNYHTRKSHYTSFAEAKSRFDCSDWSIKAKHFDLDGITFLGGNQDYSSNKDFNFDAFLSFIEFVCLASSVVISIIFAVNTGFSGRQKLILPWVGEKGLVWQCVFLVGGVIVGALIRRRQWKRICEADFVSRPVNFLERIEKVEEDLKSSGTMVRLLSRQVEKLGIRFRLTRKSLKEPIAETAALAQKNSEATRALAMQEDNLEKELGEMQKVLLAMQEQQQKQLELILAIAKSGNLWDDKRVENRGNNAAVASNSPVDGVPQL
ncbi:OLC1v1009332C1 [Oldenlandia corymbosa var. corymbosa]|uniref:OLC1v1009332C1 n=1 Tax=Oldenlandia corymbosa var. corymbosa TaxID=529605 RepID=A0AAV1DQ81_OLDCO|nr:OLC1v1009332C1 [Oldenlandia corymbosa var. corymbosa]